MVPQADAGQRGLLLLLLLLLLVALRDGMPLLHG
jgi:hypothetical protein